MNDSDVLLDDKQWLWNFNEDLSNGLYPASYAIVMIRFYNYASQDSRNSFMIQMDTSDELFFSVASNGSNADFCIYPSVGCIIECRV